MFHGFSGKIPCRRLLPFHNGNLFRRPVVCQLVNLAIGGVNLWLVRTVLPSDPPVAAPSLEGLPGRVDAGAGPLRLAPYVTLGFGSALRLMAIALSVVAS